MTTPADAKTDLTFQPELVKRCREQFSSVLIDLSYLYHLPAALKDAIIVAVLRESGHDKLVEALVEARGYVGDDDVLAKIDAALKGAGALPLD